MSKNAPEKKKTTLQQNRALLQDAQSRQLENLCKYTFDQLSIPAPGRKKNMNKPVNGLIQHQKVDKKANKKAQKSTRNQSSDSPEQSCSDSDSDSEPDDTIHIDKSKIITDNSLRKLLNQHEIKGVNEEILGYMVDMLGDQRNGGFEDFKCLFDSMKFKMDGSGRIQ